MEIGNDLDQVYFLVQSVSIMRVLEIVTIVKSITAKQIFKKHKEVKKLLWGGNLYTTNTLFAKL